MSGLRTWILAGQSNMEGAGLVEELADPSIDDRVRCWSFGSRWEPAVDPLHRFADGFTSERGDMFRSLSPMIAETVTDEELVRGFAGRVSAGLGIPFGRAVADATGAPVGLIPAALGGSSLDQWNPELRDRGGRSLYGQMLQRTRQAAEAEDIELAGILWYQGESDTGTVELAESYADRFDGWVAAARADLGVPDLPVWVVQLGRLHSAPSHPQWELQLSHWDTVREAQRTLSERVPGTAAVAAADLPLVDPIHIATPGLERLGRRLARLALGGEELRLADIARGPDAPTGMPTVHVRATGVRGGWSGSDPIPGFAIYDDAGRPIEESVVFSAGPVAGHADTVELRLTSLPDGARLGYGLGSATIVTLTDAEDMPLPVFAPQPVRA